MKEMQTHNISLNTFVLVSHLKNCGDTRDINQGSVIHADIVKKGLQNETFIANTLVDMYAKCGFLSITKEIFDDLPVKDAISWNILTAGYVEHGYLSLFEQMQRLGIPPDIVTLVCFLKACGSIRAP